MQHVQSEVQHAFPGACKEPYNHTHTSTRPSRSLIGSHFVQLAMPKHSSNCLCALQARCARGTGKVCKGNRHTCWATPLGAVRALLLASWFTALPSANSKARGGRGLGPSWKRFEERGQPFALAPSATSLHTCTHKVAEVWGLCSTQPMMTHAWLDPYDSAPGLDC